MQMLAQSRHFPADALSIPFMKPSKNFHSTGLPAATALQCEELGLQVGHRLAEALPALLRVREPPDA